MTAAQGAPEGRFSAPSFATTNYGHPANRWISIAEGRNRYSALIEESIPEVAARKVT
jgi:hypothetical protein